MRCVPSIPAAAHKPALYRAHQVGRLQERGALLRPPRRRSQLNAPLADGWHRQWARLIVRRVGDFQRRLYLALVLWRKAHRHLTRGALAKREAAATPSSPRRHRYRSGSLPRRAYRRRCCAPRPSAQSLSPTSTAPKSRLDTSTLMRGSGSSSGGGSEVGPSPPQASNRRKRDRRRKA